MPATATAAAEPKITNPGNMPTVSMKVAEACLRELLLANISTFLWGPPGIGKTAMVGQLGPKMNLPVRVNSFNSMDPVDTNGIPAADLEKMITRWLKPEFLPNIERDGPEGIWFLDEANTVSSSMMPVLFRIVQERFCGTHQIPAGWRIVMAGNRIKDRASAQRLPTPLRNKLAHIDIAPDVDSFASWAVANNVSPYLIGYTRWRPDHLHMMPPSDDCSTFPTPRSLVDASQFFGLPSQIRQTLIASKVGDIIAADIESFLQLFSQLPSLDDAIKSPKTADLPDEGKPGLCFAMSSALSRKATRQNFANIITYVRRFNVREFEVSTVIDAARRDATLQETAAFGSWHVDNQDILL